MEDFQDFIEASCRIGLHICPCMLFASINDAASPVKDKHVPTASLTGDVGVVF